MQDYYEILQVHPKADTEAIQSAYMRLLQRYDPTQMEGMADELVELARRRRDDLERAYAVLSDPQRRAAYDAERTANAAPPASPEPSALDPHTDGELLDYRPLPPAQRQERPRDFDPYPVLTAPRPQPRRSGRRARRALPLWAQASLATSALAIAIVVISLVLTDGGMLDRQPAAPAISGQAGEAGVAQNISPTPTTAEIMEAMEGQIIAARQVTQQVPDNVNAWINLGNALYDSMQMMRERIPDGTVYTQNLPRWIEASQAYSRALELEPRNAPVRSDLAASLCYYGEGVGDQRYVVQGLTEAQQAVADGPDNGRVLLNHGVCLIYSDPPQTQAALEQWRKVLALTETEPGIAFAAQQLIAQYGQ